MVKTQNWEPKAGTRKEWQTLRETADFRELERYQRMVMILGTLDLQDKFAG